MENTNNNAENSDTSKDRNEENAYILQTSLLDLKEENEKKIEGNSFVVETEDNDANKDFDEESACFSQPESLYVTSTSSVNTNECSQTSEKDVVDAEDKHTNRELYRSTSCNVFEFKEKTKGFLNVSDTTEFNESLKSQHVKTFRSFFLERKCDMTSSNTSTMRNNVADDGRPKVEEELKLSSEIFAHENVDEDLICLDSDEDIDREESSDFAFNTSSDNGTHFTDNFYDDLSSSMSSPEVEDEGSHGSVSKLSDGAIFSESIDDFNDVTKGQESLEKNVPAPTVTSDVTSSDGNVGTINNTSSVDLVTGAGSSANKSSLNQDANPQGTEMLTQADEAFYKRLLDDDDEEKGIVCKPAGTSFQGPETEVLWRRPTISPEELKLRLYAERVKYDRKKRVFDHFYSNVSYAGLPTYNHYEEIIYGFPIFPNDVVPSLHHPASMNPLRQTNPRHFMPRDPTQMAPQFDKTGMWVEFISTRAE